MAGQLTAQPVLTDNFWNAEGQSRLLKNVALALLGTALIAISAKIQVPMWPVPMTMQTFAVLVIGMAYGPRLGFATLILYLAQGAAGLPVFASGGGLAYFAGPTTGYLIGFALAAGLVGLLAERGWDRNPVTTVIANLLGTLVIFGLGVAWLAVFLMNAKGIDLGAGLGAAFASGAQPFLIGAAFKIALAAAVLPMAWKFVGRKKQG